MNHTAPALPFTYYLPRLPTATIQMRRGLFLFQQQVLQEENGERSGGGDGGLINFGPLGIVRTARDRMGSARNIPQSFNKIWMGTVKGRG